MGSLDEENRKRHRSWAFIGRRHSFDRNCASLDNWTGCDMSGGQ